MPSSQPLHHLSSRLLRCPSGCVEDCLWPPGSMSSARPPTACSTSVWSPQWRIRPAETVRSGRREEETVTYLGRTWRETKSELSLWDVFLWRKRHVAVNKEQAENEQRVVTKEDRRKTLSSFKIRAVLITPISLLFFNQQGETTRTYDKSTVSSVLFFVYFLLNCLRD